MEIVEEPAKEIYQSGVPDGIEPEQNIPWKIYFGLGDLTPDQGYYVTPMDSLFRFGIETLDIPFSLGCVILPRSQANNILQISSGGLILKAKRIAKEGEGSYVIYERRLYKSQLRQFDEFDQGKMGCLNDLLKMVRGKPIGERVNFKLEDMEMEVHTGYDWENPLMAIMAYHHEPEISRGDKYSIKLKMGVMLPWLEKAFGRHNIELIRDFNSGDDEEIAKTVKGILRGYSKMKSKT